MKMVDRKPRKWTRNIKGRKKIQNDTQNDSQSDTQEAKDDTKKNNELSVIEANF